MMPQEVRDRVRIEHDELAQKRAALLRFLASDACSRLTDRARRLLRRQEAYMAAYEHVLAERLALD